MKGKRWKWKCDGGSYVDPKTCHEGPQLYSFFNFGARSERMVKATPRSLYPRERYPLPIVHMAGSVLKGAENLVRNGIRSPERPARMKSLFRLRSAGIFLKSVYNII